MLVSFVWAVSAAALDVSVSWSCGSVQPCASQGRPGTVPAWAGARMTSVEHAGVLQMPRYHTRCWAGLGLGFFSLWENRALATRPGDGQVPHQEWT